MAKSSRKSTRKHGGKRNTRRNVLTRKNRGVFGYVAAPVTTLAKGATNVIDKTAGIGANVVFGTAGNLISTGRRAVHKLGYGASNIVETGTGAMNSAIGRLLGSAPTAAGIRKGGAGRSNARRMLVRASSDPDGPRRPRPAVRRGSLAVV